MKRQPKSVATAAGNDQSQPVQTGSDTPTVTDSAAASGTDTAADQTDTAADQTDTADGQGDSLPSSGDSAETPAPAPGAETPAEASSEPTSASEPAPAPAAEVASAPVEDSIEVRVLVAYDDYLPNDVIVMDRAEAATRLEQVDADPVAVAYAKGLLA